MSVSCIDCNEGPEPCGLHPAQPKRVCLGCDGTGRDRGFWVHPPSEPFPIRGEDVCLACQGTGYVSSVVSVRDALADAATVRMVAASLSNGRGRAEFRMMLNHAGSHGDSARYQMTHREPWLPGPEVAGEYAQHAYRAAIKAVPALRGDR